ncbi:MAG: PfkB family carbohydrate kinase, partial [Microbacterium sp.]
PAPGGSDIASDRDVADVAPGAGAPVLVISGSVPPGSPEDLIPRLIALGREAGAIVIADTSGPALLRAADAGADVLKPNAAELAEATGIKDPIEGARELLGRGASFVLLSRGAEGMLAVSPSPDTPRATAGASPVTPRSAEGSETTGTDATPRMPGADHSDGALGDVVSSSRFTHSSRGDRRPAAPSPIAPSPVAPRSAEGSENETNIGREPADATLGGTLDVVSARLPEPLAGNPTGAGDAAVAAAAVLLAEGVRDPETIVRRAVAWSASAVLMPLAGEIDPSWPDLERAVVVTHP